MEPAPRAGDPPGLEPAPAPPTVASSLAVAAAAGHGALLVIAVVVLVATGNLHHAWEAMEEGGWPMLVLLPAILLTLGTQGWYASRATRRRDWPSWILFLGPATLLLLGLGGTVLQIHEVHVALGTVATSWHPTLLAAGMSEALNVEALGAMGAALSANGVAVALAVRALSRAEAPDFDGRAVGALALALVALVLVTLYALSSPSLTGWPLLLLVPAAAGVVCVGLGGHALGGPREHATGAILIDLAGSALAIVATVWLAVVAMRSAAVLEGYGALSAKCVDGCRMVQIFAAGWTDTLRLWRPSALFAIPAVAGSATLWASHRRPRLGTLAREWATPVAGVALALFAILPEVHLRQLARGHAALLRSPPLPDDLTLVVEARPDVAIYPLDARVDLGRSVIGVGGQRLGAPDDLDHDAGCDAVAEQIARARSQPPGDPLPVAVDEAMPFRRWACLLRAQQRLRLARGLVSREAGRHALVTEVRPGPDVVLSAPYDTLLPMQQATTIIGHDVDSAIAATGLKVTAIAMTASTTTLTRHGASEAMTGSNEERREWLASRLRSDETVVVSASADLPASTVIGSLTLSDRRLAFLRLRPIDDPRP